MNKIDLISIGDNATDAFIKLSEAELNCDINRPECKICLRFASKIPYESVTEVPAGGNSSNVVLGATKLGLNTAYISNLGKDIHGNNTLAKLSAAGVDTKFVSQQLGARTNYNYVLWYQDDRTILVHHQKYNYEWPFDKTQGKPEEIPTWVYLSSVGDENLSYHQDLSHWLQVNPEIKLAFSPGTHQIKVGVEKLKDIYTRTEILFCNKQEAEKILGAPLLRDQTSSEPEVWSLRSLAEGLKKLGPKIVVITDGEKGAYCLDREENFWFMPALNADAFERTGAGDAFASGFLSAIFYNQPTDLALAWGAINASAVVTQIGPHAGLLTRAEIETKIKNDNLVAQKFKE
ncbi:MAG TPA: carbohydrate kinase family protein [Candidatus Paceibacterota bacterium]|nr:carbohydrate kinase family protein [Candidatus Paceibacterota bacterium]